MFYYTVYKKIIIILNRMTSFLIIMPGKKKKILASIKSNQYSRHHVEREFYMAHVVHISSNDILVNIPISRTRINANNWL